MLIAVLMLSSATLHAKQKDLGIFKKWTAYSEGKGKSRACSIYSKPEKKKGKYVKRGQVYALISHFRGRKAYNVVQLTAGYIYKKHSIVTVQIGTKKFKLFTVADSAWVQSKKVETALVKTMQSGARMVVTGVSSRGTRTTDTYSLSGITAAQKAIDKACGRK
ncbi:MAG: invasion associated locus B family protein [Pseudomonadota bacterium]|nr:invasion associated locus B family protein [Pseudomonadota bacterium]